MAEYSIKNVDVAEALGIHSSNVTFFINSTKNFSQKTAERYINAINGLIMERKTRRENITDALENPTPAKIVMEKQVPVKKPQPVRPLLKVKEIIPIIKQMKNDLDRYCIYQIEVSRKTGIDPARISRFFNLKPYVSAERNKKVINACEELIAEKKRMRGDI